MALRGRPRSDLVLTDDERSTLERWSRRAKSSQALAMRCRIVLACADGLSNTDVAGRLAVNRMTVGKWRSRFLRQRLDGLLSLVLTSPPYGKTMHGRVEHRRGPLTRLHNSSSQHPPRGDAERETAGRVAAEPANLAHRGRAALLDGITAMLAGCVPLLKPGGIIAVVARPWRRDHFLVDLPGQTIQAGLAAGLQLVGCRRAVHAAVRDGRLVPHHSLFQLHVALASRRNGLPVSLIQHDDIALLQAPGDVPAVPGRSACAR